MTTSESLVATGSSVVGTPSGSVACCVRWVAVRASAEKQRVVSIREQLRTTFSLPPRRTSPSAFDEALLEPLAEPEPAPGASLSRG